MEQHVGLAGDHMRRSAFIAHHVQNDGSAQLAGIRG
jgi:hypothetical protein